MSVADGPSRTQDEWIALRCQAGDNTGFEDLVALLGRPLLYYAAKLTGNGQTAYDVLQDVWVKVFSGIRGLKLAASRMSMWSCLGYASRSVRAPKMKGNSTNTSTGDTGTQREYSRTSSLITVARIILFSFLSLRT